MAFWTWIFKDGRWSEKQVPGSVLVSYRVTSSSGILGFTTTSWLRISMFVVRISTLQPPDLLHAHMKRLLNITYASAALHCMHFLSNPPNECANSCNMQLLPSSPELVQFISIHDIYPANRKYLAADLIWKVDVHILAFSISPFLASKLFY